MKVNGGFALCSIPRIADPECQTVRETRARELGASGQRAQKVDEDKRKVDVDDNVAC
jgi:hypothetical protein